MRWRPSIVTESMKLLGGSSCPPNIWPQRGHGNQK